jgi:hypothetical protein
MLEERGMKVAQRQIVRDAIASYIVKEIPKLQDLS